MKLKKEMKEELNEMYEVARFLFEKQISVHIDTFDGAFLNGLIIELHKRFIVINDRIQGMTPIAFSRIKILERYRSKNND